MSQFRKVSYFSKFFPLMVIIKFFKTLGLGRAVMQKMGERIFDIEKKKQVYQGYDLSERDIFAAVYSKSGTNWLMQTMQQVICRGEAEFEHIHQVVPWPESPFDFFVQLKGGAIPENAERGMRVIKSSSKAGILPFDEKARYVTVIRDPKECVVSGYYFLPGVFGLHGSYSPNDFVNFFTSPGYLAGSWAEHTASWWELRDRPNVLVLTFEQMKKESEGCTRKIAEFLDVRLTEEELAKVLHKSSFAWMKENEDKFGPPILPLVGKRGVPKMMRKGKTRGSKELLTQEQQARIDRYCLGELERIGSDFPYREYFPVVE